MNSKRGTQVCMYWLQGRCLKGEECNFLHSLDYDKMPLCPLGEQCNQQECQFSHKDHRDLCTNYLAGFCSFGKRCNHRHEKLDVPSYPSKYFTERPERKAGAHFRTQKCEYFVRNGWCPYFEMCNFKHE